jgi:hypothetical protein
MCVQHQFQPAFRKKAAGRNRAAGLMCVCLTWAGVSRLWCRVVRVQTRLASRLRAQCRLRHKVRACSCVLTRTGHDIRPCSSEQRPRKLLVQGGAPPPSLALKALRGFVQEQVLVGLFEFAHTNKGRLSKGYANSCLIQH